MADQTGAERHFEDQKKDPEYRAAYEAARADLGERGHVGYGEFTDEPCPDCLGREGWADMEHYEYKKRRGTPLTRGPDYIECALHGDVGWGGHGLCKTCRGFGKAKRRLAHDVAEAVL